jgi:hypothetical protein
MFAYTGQQPAPDAWVSIDQARAIAPQAVPGKVTGQELEEESGGGGLRYSFDIKRGEHSALADMIGRPRGQPLAPHRPRSPLIERSSYFG